MENKSARTILSENLQTLMKNNNIDQMELAEATEGICILSDIIENRITKVFLSIYFRNK